MIKPNSNRKNKVGVIKECKKNYTIDRGNMDVDDHMIWFLMKTVSVVSKTTIETTTKSEPPPLVFFPKNRNNAQQPIIFSATEPLVPITRNFA